MFFHFELSTAEYASERDAEDPDTDHVRAWESPGVWPNCHRCSLSSEGGFRVCSREQYSSAFLDGLEVQIAEKGLESNDADELAFSVYLLGHDAVAGHRIRFERIKASDQFKNPWTGKIALAYGGETKFENSFSAFIASAELPVLPAGCAAEE